MESTYLLRMSLDSSVGIAKVWTPGVLFPAGQSIFVFPTMSRPALRYTQSPIQWAQGTLFPGLERLEGKSDH
jgi:hypothetical protein